MRMIKSTAREQERKPAPVIPLFDTSINAGIPAPAFDYPKSEITADELIGMSPTMFLIRVNGNSMENAHMPHGCAVAVDRGAKPQPGDIIVGLLNKEFTIKRLVKSRAGWVLHPENPSYMPYLIKVEDEFEVWGVVKAVVIKT